MLRVLLPLQGGVYGVERAQPGAEGRAGREAGGPRAAGPKLPTGPGPGQPCQGTIQRSQGLHLPEAHEKVRQDVCALGCVVAHWYDARLFYLRAIFGMKRKCYSICVV